MLIKYYNNPELAYATRKRYNTFNFEPFYEEEQKAVLLGDGATTSIKTSSSNIANYVQIDDTRWFVTSYTYLNGGQVTLFLQRDVIGEFGIADCFGKIERGYTDSILKNRKELSLNQVLKKRIPLVSKNNVYGNYSVNTHEKEAWGILYLAKPTGIDPNTGEEYKDKLNINIPAFQPETVDYPFIENGTKVLTSNVTSMVSLSFNARISGTIYNITVRFKYQNSSWIPDVSYYQSSGNYQVSYNVTKSNGTAMNPSDFGTVAYQIGYLIGNYIIGNQSSSGIKFPQVPTAGNVKTEYENVVIKKDDNFYRYTISESTQNVFGTTSVDFIPNNIMAATNNKSFKDFLSGVTYVLSANTNGFNYTINNYFVANAYVYNYIILDGNDAGDLVIDITQDLVDEPYIVMAFPLYDVTITGNGETYNINRTRAFTVFNTVIQYLSGSSAYLVDAQIYPYCPVLTSVPSAINGYPFFSINSTSYNTYVSVQLLPNSDIKKEYIEREYSIISPEQSGKFTFNFYDYVNTIEDNDGVNFASLDIIIKTALKPFAIISSAVIQPQLETLMNITYESDFRGSQPSSGGFECSIATNQFEEYKRNNSNYQQIFNLQKEELQKQHYVEMVNDSVSTVVNTMTATTMGAIAGAEMADAGIWGKIVGSRTYGAAIGAGVAGATVGASMIAQTVENEKLRRYEEKLQQQMFDLEIGTIKNLPNTINRISSFNEIILKDFYYVIEVYECTDFEKQVVNNFINRYSYGIGVFDYVQNYYKNGWFLRSTLISSSYAVNLHEIAAKELEGGIYLYE